MASTYRGFHSRGLRVFQVMMVDLYWVKMIFEDYILVGGLNHLEKY
jgi:hypothetical protein